jgi:putative selenate reductase
LGPAAGPHTQLAQNIVATFLAGARYFELKTVQILDNLEIDKPCIEAENEGYNTEWSTELSIKQAYEEYIKAWLLLHLLTKIFALSDSKQPFIFNMSVGYDIKGIKSQKVDWFIRNLKDATDNEIFIKNKNIMIEQIKSGLFDGITKIDKIEIINHIKNISPKICSTIAVSTMHGCPPEEIEEIGKYLLQEKELNLLIKLNPTLLGYDYVRKTFDKSGFDDIELVKKSFEKDLQYPQAIKIIKEFQKTADEKGNYFGIKLSNTLEVKNTKKLLPGDFMYLSGVALLPLTISLANKLAKEFDGNIHISYSGGANKDNAHKIAQTGIMPVTICTDLLKPGGYKRLNQIARNIDEIKSQIPNKIDLEKLQNLTDEILTNKIQRKTIKKVDIPLPLFDCISCGFCVEVCPNRANIQLEFEVEGLKKKTQIIHLDGMCNECGNCATFCPHNNGKPFLDKLTVFANKEDFENSKNIGFYFKDNNIKLRTEKDAKLFVQINQVAKIIKDKYGFLLKNE